MQIGQVKIGQRVKVTATTGAFYERNRQQTGTVKRIEGAAVYVTFDHNGETDYGAANELTEATALAPKDVKTAIAAVETALAALKALVG